MKRKVLVFFILLLCPILAVAGCNLILKSRIDFTLIGSYSSVVTIENLKQDAPSSVIWKRGEPGGGSLNKTGYLLFQKSDDRYYGYDRDNGEIVTFDRDLNIIGSIKTDLDIFKITSYKDGIGLLVKGEHFAWKFWYYEEEVGKITPVLDSFEKKFENKPYYFDTCNSLIVYTEPDGNIKYITDTTEGVISGEDYYLLCSYDDSSFLIMRVVNEFFEISELLMYHIDDGSYSHLRYTRCPSANHCCLSPDKQYLMSFLNVKPTGQYSPVVINLFGLGRAKISAYNLDFTYSQWIEQ